MKRLLLLSVLLVPAFLSGHCGNCPGDRCQPCLDGDFTKCSCKSPCMCKKTNCGCLGMGCCDANTCGMCKKGQLCTCAEGKCACSATECCTGKKGGEKAIEIKVAKGEQFKIELPSQAASTGYTWEFKRPISEKFLKQVSKSEKSGMMPGAPGMVTYVFEAVRPGKTIIRMHSVRVWEKDGKAAAEKTFKVVISRK